MKPILFCMQLWKGDADAAYSLLRLLADIALPSKYQEADLLISLTQNAPMRDDEIRSVARAFNRVHTFRVPNSVEGWPCGPNNQAEQTWRYYQANCRSDRWNYSGLFLAEPDGIPCSRDWLARIFAEWKDCGRPAMGCFVPSGPRGVADHVNGNLILSPSLGEIRQDFARAPRDLAWDWHHRKFLMEQTHPSTTIFSDYKTPDVEPEVLVRPRVYAKGHPLFGAPPVNPAWLHGPKKWQQVHPAMRKFLQVDVKKPVDELVS